MRAKRAVIVCVALLLALPVMAEPAEGGSWWGWLAEGWAHVVRMLAGSETEPVPAEEPEAVPVEPDAAVCPPAGCVETDADDEGRPSLDPDG